VAAAIAAATASPSLGADRVITYSIAQRGAVSSDFEAFIDTVVRAYTDPRGWSLSGTIEFRRVSGAADFTLWLASPDAMTSFSDGCSPNWSCRVGRDVIVNDLRFRDGSPFWQGTLSDYRVLLVNHETGHWIGFDHDSCGGLDTLAPIMMQQSKGVGECTGNPWPLYSERVEAARMLGLSFPGESTSVVFEPPQTRGFTPLP
jgi:hypothetical protein